MVSFFENDQNVCCYGSIDLMLDKLFVNRIHLRNIYVYLRLRIINQSNTPPLKPIFILRMHSKCCCCCVRTAQATLKLQKKRKKEIKSTFNRYSILHPVCSTISNRLLLFVLSNCTLDHQSNCQLQMVSTCLHQKKKLKCNRQATSLTQKSNNNITNKEETHQIQVSQIQKNGHNETANYIDHF